MRNRITRWLYWAALGVSAIGLFGCLISTLWIGALVWIAVGAGAAYGLAARRRASDRAAAKVIADRADGQNRDYLEGRPSGMYGQFEPRELP
ncbi:hypothetical protein LRQ08_21460 [Rhodococcus qingshengii]|uniref:hypothetical protein n=1 Tax=Rhodococcus qingshengii TaxID=334542 RepID=UPI0021111C66|nr:hypothetical protein [Rhodococcus qingshengii]UUE23796.1 hypothetical protein LRQ08_21460 [Rhodococcus qingshengii]